MKQFPPVDRRLEELICIYHEGVHFAAMLGLCSQDELLYIQDRLKKSAAQSSDEDSVALRCLANAVQAFLE